MLLPRVRRLAGEHRLFTGALAAGAVLRLLASLGYPGALWFAGDSYVYLGAALRPQPNLSKSTGYSLFLRLLLPFHSLTLVTTVQHLMGLAVAVMLYVLLRRNGVSTTWSAVATLPVLLDGYLIEDEHLIMAESLFTFLLMVAMLLLLWRPGPVRWWVAAIAGLLGAYASWFHEHHGSYQMTMSTGYYVWGRVSSFADCAVVKPTGREALVCPTQAIADRTPPGNYIWHAPYVHKNLNATGGPVTPLNNTLLTNFAIHAVEAQPLDYAKTVFFNTMMSFGFPRIAYPGAGTTFYYSFHLHYVVAASSTTKGYDLLPPDNPNHEWIKGGTAFRDWLAYGHQAPGVVDKVFAVPILLYQRVVFTYGPLLALIFGVGLGGVIGVRHRGRQVRSLRLYWSRRGTTMLPWFTAVALLTAPIAVADFDYRYLLPAISFACLAAGLSFAPRRATGVPAAPPATSTATVESTVPDSVS